MQALRSVPLIAAVMAIALSSAPGRSVAADIEAAKINSLVDWTLSL